MLELYKNIKRLREEQKLSQDVLAKLTGYTDRSSIAKIEKGLVDLQQSKIELFAKALGTTVQELMGWDKLSAQDDTCFSFRIKDDSMTPMICKGDLVIVQPQTDAQNGDTVLVSIGGNSAVCRRIQKYKEGLGFLSQNPSYTPLDFTNAQFRGEEVKILGKVVELRRTL